MSSPTGIVILSIFLCLVFLALCIEFEWGSDKNEFCIPTQPPRLVNGVVYRAGGSLFTSSYMVYTLYYSGTYENSGEECLSSSNVTEAEYERQRWMYGH